MTSLKPEGGFWQGYPLVPQLSPHSFRHLGDPALTPTWVLVLRFQAPARVDASAAAGDPTTFPGLVHRLRPYPPLRDPRPLATLP